MRVEQNHAHFATSSCHSARRRAAVGQDHALDADGEGHVEGVEPHVYAVAHRARREQAGEAAAQGVEQLRLAAHVSCCPAKLASGGFSAVADERTATGVPSGAPSESWR